LKEKYELAYDDYISGMKYKDIAAKYGVSVSAVKSWKSRYWKDKKLQPKKAKVATKKVAREIAKNIADVYGELDEDKQLFCIYCLKYHNHVKAYQKVKPKVTYGSAAVMASRWYKLPEVQEEIKRLKVEMYADALLDPQDIVQKYIDIAFADLNDYLEYGRELVPVMGPFGPVTVKDELTGETVELKKEINVVKFKDSAFADGTILSEVKQGRDGASIKLSDRMKALDWLGRHMNLVTEEQRAKIDLIKAQTQNITGGNDEEIEDADDGFIEALSGTAISDWNEGQQDG